MVGYCFGGAAALEFARSGANLKGFVTRIEFHDAIHELVNLITDGFNRMDQMLESIKDQNDILHNHERGLDKIENKVFV